MVTGYCRQALLWLLLTATGAVAQSGDVVLEQTVAPRIPVYVAPGTDAEFEIVVRNDGAAAIPQITLRATPPSTATMQHWNFGLASSRCGAVRIVVVPIPSWRPSPAWELNIADLAPGERLVCRYRWSRDAASVEDLMLSWKLVAPADDPGPVGNTVTYVAGSLARLELSATPTCDGNPAPGRQHVRVTLRNRGPTAVGAMRFGSCLPPFPAFTVDGNLPGGCGFSIGPPGSCFSGGMGWQFGPSTPGQTQSCLLALSTPRPFGLSAWTVWITPPYFFSGPLQVHEIDPGRGRVALSMTNPPLLCGGLPAAATPVPVVRGVWLAWLVLGFAVVAWLLRRPRRIH